MESMEHPFQTNKSSQNPGSQASYHSGHKSNPNPGKPVKEMKNSKIFLRKLYEEILVLKKKKKIWGAHMEGFASLKRDTPPCYWHITWGTKLFINCLVHSGDGLWKTIHFCSLTNPSLRNIWLRPLNALARRQAFDSTQYDIVLY